MKKHKIYLSGGFGNILFQLVAFLHLKKTGGNCKLVTVLTESNLITKTLGWKIHENSCKSVLKELNAIIEIPSKITILKDLILGRLSKFFCRRILGVFFYNNMDNNLKKNDILFGYFLSKTFLLENKEHIRKIGKILNRVFCNNLKKLETSIVVHIRLGDSVWSKKNSKYYEEILKILQNQEEPFTVITDSIYDAKLLFKDFENIFFESNSPYEDFGLMLQSKIIFMAPSTFSYWVCLASESIESIYMPKMIYSKLGFPLKKKIHII